MIAFLSELRKRNRLLYLAGWLGLLGTFACMVMYQADTTFVLGINAWLKPMKFFLSSAILFWTMGWFLHYLQWRGKVKYYSWMLVIVLAFELVAITWQAANGRLSHFNTSTTFYLALYQAMGVAIFILTCWTFYIDYLFFRQKSFSIPDTYLWGIRLGILFFAIFSFEGGLMAARLSHTVGNVDGSPGLPLLNWSKTYGDLRVAHFFGIHSLQILPLIGLYLCTKRWQIFLFAFLYFAFVVVLLIQAFLKIPFVS